ncbi:UDP-glucose 4-epimerase [Lacrimispora xylanisolvens]|jgi:UDP-glucose 4-epimerase|uniref:UDP-glucose 4-epimerase n=1 Tax=Lacrimispora xylanisolvens TaxID=384636 RepID=A0A2S6HVV1_9FIRM|nr:polysaccharide biosynthesis protein [Hungatella xylanolytica]PPK82076.1 UDP-glucose 4-epimerase [Hungatella xylanolytica]
MFKDKTLLITGGTGSFGNAMLNRLLDTDIGEIRIFSRDEKKQDDMRKKYNNKKIKFLIGDVRDITSVKNCVRGVDYIFHAAALKQVPSCEFFPLETVKTNILGTENVLSAAVEAGVKKVVCLSTDKAVYPINAMGMSKALMEKTFISKARTAENIVICGTRYGNVMASRGSVIPLFIEQIKNGQPLTVTDPDMTRFLMNLDDAIELVLYAFENGKSGDRMVKKSPAATVGDLAQALKVLFHADNEIQNIGIRMGEKMHETLLTREEMASAMDMGDYFCIPADESDLNYAKYFSDGNRDIGTIQEYNSSNTHRLTPEELKETLSGCSYVANELKEWNHL